MNAKTELKNYIVHYGLHTLTSVLEEIMRERVEDLENENDEDDINRDDINATENLCIALSEI